MRAGRERTNHQPIDITTSDVQLAGFVHVRCEEHISYVARPEKQDVYRLPFALFVRRDVLRQTHSGGVAERIERAGDVGAAWCQHLGWMLAGWYALVLSMENYVRMVFVWRRRTEIRGSNLKSRILYALEVGGGTPVTGRRSGEWQDAE